MHKMKHLYSNNMHEDFVIFTYYRPMNSEENKKICLKNREVE